LDIYHKILLQYWGYQSFRPLQEDIIHSIADGKDTLALMPTGGGKSLTFQVPAMAQEGRCLVITPLIAIAIYSGMTKNEIDIALDNCIFGDIKFLYISPERISTEIFRFRVKKMNVNLIAIDESHCISQWGYDFRPSYLKIVELRELIPGISFIALTATATPDVVKDIQDKLQFKEKNVLQFREKKSCLSSSRNRR
jgi:ATP-dependent DNA helicase RecQ